MNPKTATRAASDNRVTTYARHRRQISGCGRHSISPANGKRPLTMTSGPLRSHSRTPSGEVILTDRCHEPPTHTLQPSMCQGTPARSTWTAITPPRRDHPSPRRTGFLECLAQDDLEQIPHLELLLGLFHLRHFKTRRRARWSSWPQIPYLPPTPPPPPTTCEPNGRIDGRAPHLTAS